MTALTVAPKDSDQLARIHMVQAENAKKAMAIDAPIILPDFYYLDNFADLVKAIVALYDDLLLEDELTFFKTFFQLSRPAQALYVRMLMRKGQIFRCSKIQYTEINDVREALSELEECGMVEFPSSLTLLDLFPLFTKSEWLECLQEPCSSSIKKDLLLTRLQQSEQGNWCDSLINTFGDPIVRLLQSDVFATFKLLYFGNGRQDLTEFILRDIGVQRFEAYKLDRKTRYFNERESIDHMLVYYQKLDYLDDLRNYSSEELASFYKGLPPLPSITASSSGGQRALFRRIQRLKIVIARQFERLSQWHSAVEIYSDCDIAPAAERRVRVLEKLKNYSQAYQLCEQMLLEGSDAEREFAKQFLGKLAKKTGDEYEREARFTPRETRLILGDIAEKGEQSERVENAVANFFSISGSCFYVENSLFLSLFGIVFWPAIYADVSGAFTHPFQFAPHDINDPDFYSRRENIIQQCWSQMPSLIGNVPAVLNFAQEKDGIVNGFVYWGILQEDLLSKVFERVPLSHFSAIFSRIWQNIKENRNGFPDLIFFPDTGGYELIEVKGPGDRLQKNQTRWLAYFDQCDIPSRVAYVQWRE